MTRRIVKPQPTNMGERWSIMNPYFMNDVWSFNGERDTMKIRCPFGRPQDMLWVKETFSFQTYFNGLMERSFPVYKTEFDGPVEWNWSPSIHMPRSAARIFLKVKNVIAEKLQDITNEDAIKEGIEFMHNPGNALYTGYKDYQGDGIPFSSVRPDLSFKSLWESINGEGSWEKNPFVWVIEFERIK